MDPATFPGLPLHQMAYFEICFQTNVNVYHLRDDDVALAIYKSRCHYDDTMHVNQFDRHLSYISNLPAYTQIYQSGTCDRHFNDIRNMKRHQLKWFVVYDFEAMLVPIQESNSAKLTWTQRHEPISVCRNVEGFTEPHCIVETDLQVLL